MRTLGKLTLGRTIAASILFAAGVFLLMAGGSIYSIVQMARSADWVAHTEEVKSQLNGILAGVLDLESANRGYLLTGQDDYARTFDGIKSSLDTDLDKLRQLISDNAVQLAHWARLKSLTDQKTDTVAAIIAAQRQNGQPAAMALFNASEPRQIGAQLRDTINQMSQEEDHLLAQRQSANTWSARFSIFAAVSTSAIGLVVLTIAAWAIVRQLEARSRAETQLDKARANLQGIMDNSPAGILLKDLNGRYIFLNEPMRHLLGLEPAACLGKTAAELFSSERAEVIRKEDAEVLTRGATQEIELEIACPDGVQRVFHTMKFPLRDQAGRIYAIGGISTDITERRYMTNELRRALDAAEAASRTKSQFLANMSHELRTPLNSIIGFSEILSDRLIGTLSDKQLQYTTNILSSGRHLLMLINDLLDLAKIEAGKIELDPEVVSAAALVEQAVAQMRSQADRKGIMLEIAPVDPSLTVRLDPARARQIIYNLASNAIKFTPKGGRVTVMAERVRQPLLPPRGMPRDAALGARLPGDWLHLSITDTGIGIAARDLESIFNEFEQVDSTFSRQQEGTGLGLTLTRKLVDLHGGYVWAESPGQVSRGSTFHILQPVNGPAHQPDRQPLIKPPSPPSAATVSATAAPTAADGRPLVLIIEDDQQASHLIAEHLINGGYSVAFAASGEEALRQAAALQPAAITLDVMLPDANGMDVLARLKAGQATSHIPVVIISVSDDRQVGLSLGAAEFFVKPVNAEKLLDALGRARARSKKDFRRVLVVDDEADARESIAAILEPRGYEISHSASGEEALRLLDRHLPDIAIIDLTMPGMSGFELVNHLRENPATRELPICVYTAKDLSSAELHWLRERSAPVTPKPFREQLMAELQRIRANSDST